LFIASLISVSLLMFRCVADVVTKPRTLLQLTMEPCIKKRNRIER